MIKMTPFDCYKTYLGLKNHFTKDSYDYHKYCGKTRASLQSFYKRKDRYWFEKISRQKNDDEVKDFFVSNFVVCDDPQTLWIGEIIRSGNTNYTKWQRRNQSLAYIFREEMGNILANQKFDVLFVTKNGHPVLLKKHLSGNVSIETMVILEKILGYKKQFDKDLHDPVWELTSLRIKKYIPFLNIDIFKYKKILKELVL